jgi:hypothetical protein
MATPARQTGEIVRSGGLSAVVFVLGVMGCGEGSTPVPNMTTYKVEGQVLLPGGQPLTNARVTFVPKAYNGTSLPASGELDGNGRFVLTTKDPDDGAAAGEYVVRVAPNDLPTSTGKAKTKVPFPLKYSDVESSGLEVTIKPEPTKLPPFRLKK